MCVTRQTAHRQSGEAQRPAAAAGGCQAAPGAGDAEGVGGTPRPGERLCERRFGETKYASVHGVERTRRLRFVLHVQLLKEAVESQRICELMKQQEVHLKQQVWPQLSTSNLSGCCKQ